MSIEFYPAKNLSRLLKERYNVPIIWGGVHAIIEPEECTRYADYVCAGEGEHAIVSLLEYLRAEGNGALPEIPGVWVNYNGNIIRPRAAQPEMNLDSLPFQEYLPDHFFGFHNNRVYNFAENQRLFRQYALYGGTCHMMITTRGCPFHCSYCGNSAFMHVFGRKVRERSVKNVIDEIKEVIKNPFILYINFQDDCFFTHNKEWMEEFSRSYKEHIKLPFIARAIPTMLDKERLSMLVDAGLCWIVMGIQSGSDRVNYEVYNRNIRFSAVKNAADLISETHAAPFYEMIVDNPYETEQEKIETIDAVSTLKKPYIVSLAHLTFFPGTPLAEKAVKDKIVTPDAYLFRYLLNIDETYLNKLLAITSCMPRSIVKYLNKPETQRKPLHIFLLNILHFMIKRSVEPVVLLFITIRSLDYKINWIVRTILGNWRSTFGRLVSRYLGKSDLEFDQRLAQAKKNMPGLFEKK